MHRKREKMGQIVEVCQRPNDKPPKRRVVRDDGKLYESLTAAALDTGCTDPYQITAAIQRNGRTMGHRFTYAV